MVLGHTSNQISILAELDPEEVSHLKPQTVGIDFADSLRQFVKSKLR